MKAAIFKAPGQPLAIESVPDPVPGPGEMVIKVGRCGVCGTDLHRTEAHEGFTLPTGSMLGHEFAGEVVALGSGVEGFRTGDRITAMPFAGCGQCESCRNGLPLFCRSDFRPMIGGFAEYARVGFRESVKLPDALSLADGALVEPLAVGLRAVRLAGIGPGARVLVIGAGPIGLATIYWAAQAGAAWVIVQAASTRRRQLVEALGGTELVAAGETTREELLQRLGGEADVVFEAAGMPGLIEKAVDFVRPCGKVVVMGLCMSADTFMPAVALRKGLQMIFSTAYDIAAFRGVVDALDAGQVEARAMVTDTVSMADFPQAFEALRRPAGQVKLMLDPWKVLS